MSTGKSAGEDKRLGKKLERHYEEELSTPESPLLQSSSLGDMSKQSTRRLLINLISTLNASDPDYDFSSLSADDFHRVESLDSVAQEVNSHLVEIVEEGDPKFLETLWNCLDKFIDLRECEIYTCTCDELAQDTDALWSFNYFFVNSKKKQIVYFSCYASARPSETPADEDTDELDVSMTQGEEGDDATEMYPSQEEVDRDEDE